jgi:hypothetical protein
VISLASGSAGSRALQIQILDRGVLYETPHGAPDEWYLDPTSIPGSEDVIAFVSQLEELGLALVQPDGIVLPWHAFYRVIEQEDFAASSRVLPVPPIDESVVPALFSSGTLSDSDLRIGIASWHRIGGGRVADHLELCGPVHQTKTGSFTLSERVYLLTQAIREFATRPAHQHSATDNRLGWGSIRALALACDAPLDNFLRETIVLRPSMLRLGMERVHVGDDVAVRVSPTFEDAPDAWLGVFDRARLSQLYKVVDSRGGYNEIIVENPVHEVLAEIKRLPGRTVAGPRARQLIENPVAFFGGSDGVLDERAVEEEMEKLRADAFRFRPQVSLAETGEVAAAGIAVEPVSAASDASAELRLFSSPDVLAAFLARARAATDARHSFFSWNKLELEVGAEAEDHLATLERVLEAWRAGPQSLEEATGETEGPRPYALTIDADLILDLSRYHDRVEAIGIETPYGIISVPLTQKGAWLPDDKELELLLTGFDGAGETPVAFDRKELTHFVEAVAEAEKEGRQSVPLPRGGTMPLAQAQSFVEALPRGLIEELPTKQGPGADKPSPRGRTGLLLKRNVDELDYVTRREIGLRPPEGAVPLLPTTLRPGASLKDHQLYGLLWLQHLFTQSPDLCRGALLADDMGLGKTLQVLALIARAREDDPDLDPALVVAPVTLLDNWNKEIERFFTLGSLPVITLYGEQLKEFKVHRGDIDARLRAEGLQRFLRPGWHEGAAIVLTTYETLRDYEFSFGDVRWSIVTCDEAQRIKNPNALVSRAAKKLKSRFCLAATGTPVENNLTDLWSLFDFIQPGLLEPLNVFNRNYRRPIEAKTDLERERVDELRRIIEPQILRRVKSDVARDLPNKLFDPACRSLKMSTRQRQLYAGAIQATKAASAASKTGTEILELINVLRRICTDPRAGGELEAPLPPLSTYRQTSPKLDWLIATLESIRAKGEKAIVFIDRRDIQRLVQAYVREAFGFAPEIINGETPTAFASPDSRQRRIDRFQSTPGFSVIVLSPIAAGVGLNIQEANHVIHFMRHWNPAKEDQATDRAYRIGQERDVYVYTPIVTGDGWISFDERLDELLERKRDIATNMLNGADDVTAQEFADLVA